MLNSIFFSKFISVNIFKAFYLPFHIQVSAAFRTVMCVTMGFPHKYTIINTFSDDLYVTFSLHTSHP